MSQGSTEELRARDYVLALLWRAQARAALALSLQTTFVFRPGGVAGANVYTSWPAMMAAVGRVAGPKWIEIDATHATADVPAGTWNVDDCTIQGFSNTFPTLTFVSGAQLAFDYVVVSNVQLGSASSTPIANITSPFVEIVLQQGGQLSGSPAAPFVEVQNGGSLAVLSSDGTIGDGTNVAIATEAGGTTFLAMFVNSELAAGALGGPVPASVNITSDFINAGAQPTAPHFTDVSDSSQENYTPSTPGNWNPTPTTVRMGLDQLAAPNAAPLFNAAPLGPSVSVSLSVSVTKHKSGKFLITASLSGTAAAPASVLIFLQKDAAGIGGITSVETTGGGNNWWGSISWIDTAADDNPHTYAVLANSASALTVNTNQAIINVIES
jgi:hypothetical protein